MEGSGLSCDGHDRSLSKHVKGCGRNELSPCCHWMREAQPLKTYGLACDNQAQINAYIKANT